MTDHIELIPGRSVAVRERAGLLPTILFLPGYASDMTGAKATAIDAWAAATGRACVRFDYSGTGESPGAFEDGTIDRWRDEAIALVDRIAGPVVLVGSSMGGWLMLLVALARPDRITALVGIAAALDFTDWGFTQDEKMTLLVDGRLERPSAYGPPIVTTRNFWQSGEANRLLQHDLPLAMPVRLLHGMRDPDVPWHHSPHLATRLRSADVQVTLVKEGDHRLSRDADIALLIDTIGRLTEPA